MGGVRSLLVAVIAALLCIAEGRPQSGDQRSETFLVQPFSQSDRRHGHEGIQQSSNQPVRQFSQAVVREDARDNSQSLPVRPFSQSNQREGVSESFPVRPFNQYDSRGGGGGSQRVVPVGSTQSVRLFSSQSGTSERGDHAGGQGQRDHQRQREEDQYQSRAHSTPHNPRITLQTEQDRQHQQGHHHQTQRGSSPPSSQENRRKDETPNWSTSHVRLDPKRGQSGAGDGRGHSAAAGQQQSSSTPLHRDNRRTNTQDQRGKPRGQQGGADRGSSVRMGDVDVPAEGAEKGKSESAAEEGIVFPGPTRENGGGKVTPGRFAPPVGTAKPNCAQGSTFCESTDNYPSEYLKAILQKEAEGLKEFFGNDLLQNDTTLSQRIDYIDENPLCQSVEQVVYPKMAQNKEDKWLYVVNQDQYIQGVRVEKCLKPESECSLTKSFPLGYKTLCRQKYIYRRMLALNDDGKALSDTFRLPSCCSCFVKPDV